MCVAKSPQIAMHVRKPRKRLRLDVLLSMNVEAHT
jgi:hypothetical protein